MCDRGDVDLSCFRGDVVARRVVIDGRAERVLRLNKGDLVGLRDSKWFPGLCDSNSDRGIDAGGLDDELWRVAGVALSQDR